MQLLVRLLDVCNKIISCALHATICNFFVHIPTHLRVVTNHLLGYVFICRRPKYFSLIAIFPYAFVEKYQTVKCVCCTYGCVAIIVKFMLCVIIIVDYFGSRKAATSPTFYRTHAMTTLLCCRFCCEFKVRCLTMWQSFFFFAFFLLIFIFPAATFLEKLKIAKNCFIIQLVLHGVLHVCGFAWHPRSVSLPYASHCSVASSSWRHVFLFF